MIALATAPPAPPEPPPKRTEADVIEELQNTVSASRLSTFQRCRLQFYFRYVAEIKTPPTASLYVGQVIHAVLQSFNLQRWRGTPLTAEDQRTVFEQVFDNAEDGLEVRWENEADRAEQRKLGWSVLETYFKENPIPLDEKPAGVEVAVEADLSPSGLPTLIGVIDLVRPNGRLVDYKSSSKTPNQESLGHLHETQLSCYAVLYRESTGAKESGFDLHHLIKLKKQPKLLVSSFNPMSQAQQDRLYRVMESYLRALDQNDFVPSPGIQCMSCEFFGICRRWPSK